VHEVLIIRNPNPFTLRQQRFIQAILRKLAEISNPKDYISHESFKFTAKQTVIFGQIPTLIFHPHSNQIKAEIVRNAGLISPERESELEVIRQQYGITARRHNEARLFNSEWDNLMFGLKKHVYAAASINRQFAAKGETISDPINLIQNIILQEYKDLKSKQAAMIIKNTVQANQAENRRIKPYNEELLSTE
jgi:hypothetical protein